MKTFSPVWMTMVAALWAGALPAALAHRPPSRLLPPDGVIWTTRKILSEVFAASERVSYVELTREQDGATARAGAQQADAAARGRARLFIATSKERMDGMAYISPRGALARFLVAVSPDGEVTRVVVMELKDGRQTEILDPRFLAQFVGCSQAGLEACLDGMHQPAHARAGARAATGAVRSALELAEIHISTLKEP